MNTDTYSLINAVAISKRAGISADKQFIKLIDSLEYFTYMPFIMLHARAHYFSP